MADVLLKTYESIGNREDLIDIITNISPIETPMLSRFGKTSASATKHEWLTDSLADAAANAVVEGADVETTAVGVPTRVDNNCQIARKTWRVSSTQEVVDKAGRTSEYAYQMTKKMKELARDMEYALVNGTGNSGASGTARELKGVVSFISTNVETGSGTGTEVLTEDMYNDLLQTIFTTGGNPDVTYANGFQKRKISGFSTPSTRNINAEDGKLRASIDIYQSDFGLQTIILDRYMSTDTIVALEEDKWKVAMLRPVSHTELPNAGGGKKGMVETEFTLEALQEAASGKITQLTTS